MKQYFFNTQILIILMLVLTLVSLMWYGRGIDSRQHDRIMHFAHDIIEDDAQLNQRILLVRMGQIRHYDDLNEDISHMQEELHELIETLGDVYATMPANIDEKLKRLEKSFQRKEELLERFKSSNAIARNSLMYFTLSATRVNDKTREDSRYAKLSSELAELSIHMMKYYRNPNSNSRELLDKAVTRIDTSSQQYGENLELDSMLRHGRMASEQISLTDNLLNSLLDIGISEEAYAIVNDYLRFHDASNERVQRSGWMISIVAFLLIFYLAYLFVRLRYSAKQLTDANVRIAEEKDLAEITLGSIADGVITTDSNGDIKYMNPIAEHLTGIRSNQALGKPVSKIFCAFDMQDKSPIEDPVRVCLSENRIILNEDEYLLIAAKGDENIIKFRVAPIRDEEQTVYGAVMVFHDVSETHQLIKHISHQARHDSLTGLLNRREFEHRLEQTIVDSAESNVEHAICFIDLDQFKIVNDTCGHTAGDELLKQLSHLLQEKVRGSDTLARLGGDEFGMLLNTCPLDKAIRIAEQLQTVIQEFRFVWQNHLFDVGASIGLVPITPESDNAVDIMSKADIACYAAKDAGRNRVHVYSESDLELQKRHTELHTAAIISKAIDEERFELYCQSISPAVTLEPQIQHYEILVRMITEDGEQLPPGAFIPAAERYNLMTLIDKWVIRESFKTLADLNVQTVAGSTIYEFSINLSGNSLGDPGLKNYILDMVALYRVKPEWVCFEITETSAVSNLNDVIELIGVLKQAGFRFSLDDFGSGMSSFTYLKTLDVDYLKIDGSFVRDIVDDVIDFTMVESINQIGHVMGIKTIAEFVENDRILEKLQLLEVDYVQGYGIDKPKPVSCLKRNQEVNSFTQHR